MTDESAVHDAMILLVPEEVVVENDVGAEVVVAEKAVVAEKVVAAEVEAEAPYPALTHSGVETLV